MWIDIVGQGKYAEALPYFERALQICERQQDMAAALNNISGILHMMVRILLMWQLRIDDDVVGQGKYDEAEDNLKKAVERQPKDATIYDHLAEVYFKQEKMKDAVTSWEKSVRAWEAAGPSEREGVDIAGIQKKLERAKSRLAKNRD